MLKQNPYIVTEIGENGELYLVDTYNSNIFKVKPEQAQDFLDTYKMIDGKQEILSILEEKKILYDEEVTEILDYDGLYEKFMKDMNEDLSLTLLPTEGCNFRCMYCYEEHESKVMSKEVQDAVVAFVEKNIDKYKAIRIEWFGGEPLCKADTVDYVSQKVIEVCKKAKKPYVASMTTNGYLLDLDTFKRMVKKNRVINYQITLDGLEESHNIQRPLANKDGTFNTILNNLRAIRDNFKSAMFHITVRCNVTNNVMKNFPEYVDMLSNEFGDDERFSVFWKIAWEPNHKSDKVYCEEAMYENLLEMAKGKNVRLSGNRGSLSCFGKICYASYPGSYVFGADGQIYKCTVIFDEDINQIGMLKKDGTMEIDKKKEEYWVGKIEANNIQMCKECSLAPTCLGISCRKACKDPDGNIHCHPSNVHTKSILRVLDSIGGYFENMEV